VSAPLPAGHVLNSLSSTPHGLTLADVASQIAGWHSKLEPPPAPAAPVPAAPAAAAAAGGFTLGGAGDTTLPGAGAGAVVSAQAPLARLPPVPVTPAETALMMRSMLATLFVSDGVPCISAGDEYGHTRMGRVGTFPCYFAVRTPLDDSQCSPVHVTNLTPGSD
jgi:hypothetical protein